VTAAAPLLEGSLRELALADVLQLLELGRRSGSLHVTDEARGLRGEVLLADGAVAGARLAGRQAVRDAEVQAAICAMSEVRVGRFAFVPAAEGEPAPAARRLRVEGVLVEAARRADDWARLGGAVPHAEAVPVLADGGDAAPLALDARAWALLAEVDGARDVVALAAALGRDPLELARELAVLARLGVVSCAAGAVTPPAGAAPAVPSPPARSSTR
jgi:hypothetical protein